MSINYLFATVAYLEDVSVKNLPQFVSSQKAFVNKTEERSAYVALNVSAEWWIVPDYVPRSITFMRWWCLQLLLR